MKNFYSYFKHEIISKLFSSKKKIIKFVAICLVPFLYGFVCIWAFWNPMPNIGKVPMAIVDTSTRIDLAIGIDNNKKMIIGEADQVDSNGNVISVKNPEDAATPIQLTNVLLYKKDYSFVESFLEGWTNTKIKDSLIYKNDDGTYTINVSETTPLNNVSYFNDRTNTKAKDIASYNPNYMNPITQTPGGWEVKNEDYWLQIQVPTQFNSIFAKTLTNIYQKSNEPGISLEWTKYLTELKNEPINIWKTFKKNFLFGQFMKVFEEFKSSLYINFFPRLLVQTLTNIVISTTNSLINHYHDDLFFNPTNDINTTISATFHNGTKQSAKSKIDNLPINLKANEKYLFRNNEIKTAFMNAIANDVNISQADKDKLTKTYTYEGDTSNLTNTNNDWVHNADDLSFIGLNLSLIKPIINIISPTTFHHQIDNSNIYAKLPLSTLSKYATNKMFLTALFEKDKGVLPNKAIVNVIYDGLVGGIIETLPDTGTIFSNHTLDRVFVTESQWNGYIDTFSLKIKNIFNALINSNSQPNAPPAQNNGLDGIVTSGVIGRQFSQYGVGLGQFFLFIGIWVGVLMQTFMLDRKRRGPAFKLANKNKKTNTFWTRIRESLQWFYSKTLMMLFITFIQVTILSAAVAAIGWWQIGPAFALIYLQLLFSGFVFTVLIQSLWFFFRDEVIGKFIVILLLIVNLSSGWGTFPPKMQFDFFYVLSYIAPFTYQIRNVGAITYGIAVQGSNIIDNLFILQNIAISLIYVVISFLLASIGSMKLTKMQYYGTYNERKLARFINESLNYNEQYDLNSILIYKKTILARLKLNNIFNKPEQYLGINWDNMPQGYDQYMCTNFNQKHPYEVKFKWFKEKYFDQEEKIEKELDVVL